MANIFQKFLTEISESLEGYNAYLAKSDGSEGRINLGGIISSLFNRSNYDATIGTGGDYPATTVANGLKQALLDGNYNLKVLSDFTVFEDLGVHSKDIVLDADELKIVTFTVNNTEDVNLHLYNIDLQGLSVARFTANSSILISNTSFATGFTVFNNNVTISNCKVSTGTITIDALASNTIIENCTTLTPIIYDGVNTRLFNNYATNGNPSTNVLEEKTTIIAKTSAGGGDILDLQDVNGDSKFKVTDEGEIIFQKGANSGRFKYLGGIDGFALWSNRGGGSPIVFRLKDSSGTSDIFTVNENGVLGIFDNITLPATKKIKFGNYSAISEPTSNDVRHEYRGDSGDIHFYDVNLAQITFRINQIDGFVINTALKLTNIPTYADEAAAITAGLASDSVYKTATGELRIKL